LRYPGFRRIVLLDYSRTQLKQAQERLGRSECYLYVAADIYRQPFVDGLFDAATMIRTLPPHGECPRGTPPGKESAFSPVRLSSLNMQINAILNPCCGMPSAARNGAPTRWNRLNSCRNFDFHPRAIREWLRMEGFIVEKVLTVPTSELICSSASSLPDSWPGWIPFSNGLGRWGNSPRVYSSRPGWQEMGPAQSRRTQQLFFKCPQCGQYPLIDQATS